MADFSSAVFRCSPISVEYGGDHYLFRLVHADEWMSAMASAAWPVHVLYTAEPDSYEQFVTRVEDGALGRDDLEPIARKVLAEASGRTWWQAMRLMNAVLGSDRVAGAVLSTGVDPSRMTLAAFLAVVFSCLTRDRKPEDVMQLEAELMAPPPEAAQELEQGMDLAQMAHMFRGMQGARVG